MRIGGLLEEFYVQVVALHHALDALVADEVGDALVAILAEGHLLADVEPDDHLLLEGCADADLGGLRVEPPVELGRGRGVTRAEEGSAHVDDALDEGHDLGGDAHGGGQVDARADGQDGHLAGVGLDAVDDEVDGLHVERLYGRLAAVLLEVDGAPRGGLGVAGGTDVGVADAEEDALVLDRLEAVGIDRLADAGHDGDVCPIDALQLADGVGGALGHPGVADDDGDAQEVDVGGLGEHHHGYAVVKDFDHVGVQDHLLFLLRRGAFGGHAHEADEGHEAEGKDSRCFHFCLGVWGMFGVWVFECWGVYLFICLSVYLFICLCVWVRVIGCVEIGAGVYTGRFHGRRVGARPGS